MYILWIRHGFSCANYMKMTDRLYKISGHIEYDAPLTKLGYEQAYSVGPLIFDTVSKENKKLEFIPIFFSSMLSRALETAYNMKKGLTKVDSLFSKIPIVAVPYIEEKSAFPNIEKIVKIDKQNEPQNINILEKELPFKVNVLENLNPYSKSGEPITRVSVKKFYKDSLPKIFKNLRKSFGYRVNNNSVLILVSHGHLIKEATGVNIGNVGAVLQKVSYYKGSWVPDVKSKLIFPGFTKEYYKTEKITSKDLENCRSKRVKNSITKS